MLIYPLRVDTMSKNNMEVIYFNYRYTFSLISQSLYPYNQSFINKYNTLQAKFLSNIQ